MSKIEFYYDFGSPKCYLVHKTLPKLAKKYSKKLFWKPILLGGVFKLTNNQSPIKAFNSVKGKLEYDLMETKRFISRHKINYKMNPYFPVMTMAVMRGALYSQDKEWEFLYRDTVFDAIWVHEKKMDDPETINKVLADAKLPATEILMATQDNAIKSQLINWTNEAVSRGIFGAPTAFIGKEMFFGKECIFEIEDYLKNA